MRYMYGDIFSMPSGPSDALCVTTNGMVRKDGHAVMGRGIALTANRRFQLSKDLGEYLPRFGNVVFNMGVRRDAETGREMRVFTFPTKNDWRNDSDPALIAKSARNLVEQVDRWGVQNCYLTRPGCANGHLDWETQVRPILEPILDDRFVIVDWA